MALPDVATREQWLEARKRLLILEKQATRERDALNVERRRLPMVRIDKPYTFHGPAGTVSLLDLFDGPEQLVMHHFMWSYHIDDQGHEHAREVGCPVA